MTSLWDNLVELGADYFYPHATTKPYVKKLLKEADDYYYTNRDLVQNPLNNTVQQVQAKSTKDLITATDKVWG